MTLVARVSALAQVIGADIKSIMAKLVPATASQAGFISAADKAKLDGMSAGATSNRSDAALLSRANHTGTQPASTITGLGSAAAVNIQSGPLTDLGDSSKVARVGCAGFGGSPLMLGSSVSLAALLDNPGISKVMRVDDGSTGLHAYAPILHAGGIDTWWQFQVDYSTGGARIAHGIGQTRYGIKNLIGDWLKAGVDHALAGTNNEVWMTPLTTKAVVDAATARPVSAPVLEIAASMTLAATNVGQFIWSTTSSAITVTVPANSEDAIAIGAEIHIGAFVLATVTVVAASGVTLDLPNGGTAVLDANMNATLKKMQTNRWRLMGQVRPA